MVCGIWVFLCSVFFVAVGCSERDGDVGHSVESSRAKVATLIPETKPLIRPEKASLMGNERVTKGHWSKVQEGNKVGIHRPIIDGKGDFSVPAWVKGVQQGLRLNGGLHLLHLEAAVKKHSSHNPDFLGWSDLLPVFFQGGVNALPKAAKRLSGREVELTGFAFPFGSRGSCLLVPSAWSIQKGLIPSLCERVLISLPPGEKEAVIPVRVRGVLRVEPMWQGRVIVSVYWIQTKDLQRITF